MASSPSEHRAGSDPLRPPPQRWTVGRVQVTKIVEMESLRPSGGSRTALPEAYPEAIRSMGWLFPHYADAQGSLRVSIHAFLVQTPGMNLLVDTCVGNDKRRSAPHFDRLSTRFLDHLAEAGCTREQIDAVVCTHLHVDHVGWNTMWDMDRWVPTFPHARYYFGRAELAHWQRNRDEGTGASGYAESVFDSQVVYADSVAPILLAGLATLVENDAVLCPEIRLVPTPGHTPGHASVLIESDGQRGFITGDMMHHPCQISRPDWSSSFDDDPEEARRTRMRVVTELANSATLVFGTHFCDPSAGRVKRYPEGYRFEA